MRERVVGTLLTLLAPAPILAGEAGRSATGPSIEAIVSPSGKIVATRQDETPMQRATETPIQQPTTCPKSAPLPSEAARDLVEKVARDENFYPEFILSVARAESRFHSDAVSPRGAIGLMQLEPETARHYGVDICDPADNVRGGVRFLRDLASRYRNPLFILAAYNAGEKALIEHGGVPPFPETLRFVAAVVNDFYDWPKIAGKARVAPNGAPTPRGANAESASKDERWRSGFVWNVEQNGESE